MKKIRISRILGIVLVFVMVGFVFDSALGISNISASLASKDNIILDEEYRDYQSMSLEEIQSWLENPRWGDTYLGRASYLATYTTTDWLGFQRSAAEIIYNAARDYVNQGYQINPEVILTTLQKEQSLITDPNPSQSQLDWAMGYGSYGDYLGFGKQVDAGGWQLGYNYKYIQDHGSKNGWGVGIPKETLDGVIITPQNIATACLYNYTPHAGSGWGGSGGGNYLFWDLYYNQFRFDTSSTLSYPQPIISVGTHKTEINVGETDWVTFTVTNDGTEYTPEWGIQVRVGDGLELVEHPSYPWDELMCNDKAAEWYHFYSLIPGNWASVTVGINGKSASDYESVWYTAWMHDPDGQPKPIQYAHSYNSPCDRQYAEYGVSVIADNSPPQLSNGYVDPLSGDTSTDFYYYVTYFDPDGDSPSAKQVIIDGIGYTMSFHHGVDSQLTYYYGPKNLSAGGTHYYFFYFEDGRGGWDRLPSGIDMYLGPSVSQQTYPPEVTTTGASNITTSSAALWGNLDSTGGLDCQVWFEYGITTSYGSSTPELSMSSEGPFGAIISSLSPDTTYHFRACASNSEGTRYGSDMTFTTITGEVVTFRDPNLEATIREAIGKPTGNIYRSDVEALTELFASGRSIADLSGLEYCINLEVLYLSINQISDVGPVFNLVKLKKLFLGGNQISNIGPLSNLTKLETLWLPGNEISDVGSLSNLTNLGALFLHVNQISDVGPLSNLTNLWILDVSRNQISDIGPLSNLTNLETLWLYNNEIVNLQPLANLNNLRFLYCHHNQINNLEPLSNLTKLEHLSIGSNPINDIQPLSNLTGLVLLILDETEVSNLEPLSNLTKLEHLQLESTEVSNLEPLSNLTDLKRLFLFNCQVTNLEPLSNLAKLEVLDLAWNEQIENLEPLSNLTNLRVLWASLNQISDIQALTNLVNLEELDLGHNRVRDIQALSNLTNLELLELESNQISDIQPLSGLTRLKWWLNLAYNQISDISPLVQNVGLGEGDTIELRANPLSADSLNTYIPQLEERGVVVLYDAPRTWYVDDDRADYPAADFTNIQDAVNAASPGDTIVVYPGTYTENVDINKSLTIQSENGAAATIVQAANHDDHVFEITADYVNVSGFAVEGATGIRKAGFRLSGSPSDNVEHCTISNNIASKSSFGILLSYSSNNVLTSNTARSNSFGIHVEYSSNNILATNIATSNHSSGIGIWRSPENTLTNNMMSNNNRNFSVIGAILTEFNNIVDTSNKVDGKPIYYWVDKHDQQVPDGAGYVALVGCTNITVRDLTLSNNGQGVLLAYTTDSSIENVTVLNNSHGIYLSHSSNNILASNLASHNWKGISLDHSCDNFLTNNTLTDSLVGLGQGTGVLFINYSCRNTLTGNVISSNERGMQFWVRSSDNTIYLNNLMDNGEAVYISDLGTIYESINIWNCPEEISYSYNGNTYTNYLGNYWSDYAGGDANGDGIGDSPYSIYGDSSDNYPLMEPFENYILLPSEQPQLKAPWEGTARISQGNHGSTSHFDHGTWDNTYAIDVALPVGSDVLAPAAGVVNWYDDDPSGAGGKELAIEHTGPTGKKYTTVYLHLSEIIVKSGFVRQGEVVAKSGQSGDVTGPHLHFHIWSGEGSRDSHTIPIERLVMKQVGIALDFREYDARKGDLDDDKIAGKYFESNNIPLENQKPVASIDLDYAYVQSGFSIAFNGSSSDDPDGMIVDYEWDFGDGTVLEGPDLQSVEHRFRGAMVDPETLVPEIKNYTVTLTVTDDKGAAATDTASIDVVPLQKTIENTAPPAPTPGGSARMTAYYNWIGVTPDTGEDVYVVSAIHFEAEGFVSHLLTVWDEYSFSIGIPAWSEAVIHFWHPVERTFAYPFGTYRDCTYTFDDGYFQGMAVGPSDEMRLWSFNVVSISGAIGPVWFGVSAPFAPDLAGEPITDEAPPDLTLAHLCSPAELRVYDSQGSVTGLVNGEVKEEIPDSGYSDEIVVILNPSDSYWYEVLGTDDGEYGLAVTSAEDGESATFTATDIPTSSGAVHEYTIDWDALSQGKEGVTLEIDADGDGVFEGTITSDATLQPPEAEAGGPYVAVEGSAVAFDASGSFDPDGSIALYEWDFDDDEIRDFSSSSPWVEYVYGDDYNGNATLRITDDDGLTSVDTGNVTVTNVVPTVGNITAPLDPVPVNTPINTGGNFTDPGFLDTHTAVWDWGDGKTSSGTVNETNGSVSGNHTYASAGVYTVTLSVTDDDGGTGESIFRYVVVYDPSAGFVTGGGWIDSLAGAYAPDTSLTGKATFGFVSRYRKGASVPTGQTEFQFHVANMNFKSTSYQWLVIARARAMYKGTGTINGEGNYGFMLSAIDEKLTPSTDVDLFRIRIWDKDNDDTIVYDNQMGDYDYADLTTAISGGSIVIHAK